MVDTRKDLGAADLPAATDSPAPRTVFSLSEHETFDLGSWLLDDRNRHATTRDDRGTKAAIRETRFEELGCLVRTAFLLTGLLLYTVRFRWLSLGLGASRVV